MFESTKTPPPSDLVRQLDRTLPRRRHQRLDDEIVQDLLKLDLTMIRAIRKIARGEALVDLVGRKALRKQWSEAVASAGLDDQQADVVLELLEAAFGAGVDTTINPLQVVRAFESLVRVGHQKLWTPPEARGGDTRNVMIVIQSANGDGAKALAAPIETKALEGRAEQPEGRTMKEVTSS